MFLENFNMSRGIFALFILCAVAGCAQDKAGTEQQQAAPPPANPAQSIAAAPADATARTIAQQMPTYPTSDCVVCGSPLTINSTPVDVLHEGRLVRVC